MKIINNKLHLAATDLANHLACKHLTQLEIQCANKKLKKPVRKNHFLDRIIERGNSHEEAYVNYLKSTNKKTVIEFDWKDSGAKEKTIDAMKQGVEVIAQGGLGNENYGGRPDFLIKVDTPSPAFGNWSYEVADTKLTQTTKASTILQLCVYSDLITELQGIAPVNMHVVMPNDDEAQPFQNEAHRYDDYTAYYRLAKAKLNEVITKEPNSNSYPEPVTHCDICQWWPDCDKRRRDDDHLTFVAGIQTFQINELKQSNIGTLTQLATADTNTIVESQTGSADAIDRVHKQAQIQHKGINSGKPEFEFIDVIYPDEHNTQLRGFLKLPAPCKEGDLFFDIESARHAPGGGLEYLLGFAHGETDKKDVPKFSFIWGLDRQGEKKAFEDFIDLAMNRLDIHPDMHIYHFAPYETAAMKRLATRHATREDELDVLLRKQCFVDLYAITRQSIRASVESYSIKCLEKFYGYEREEELAEARLSMHRLEEMLEIGASKRLLEKDKAVVLKYNRDDCISTLALRNWLEELRQSQIDRGIDLPRPPTLEDYKPDKEEHSEEVAKVFEALTDGLLDIPKAIWDDNQKARWLLAHCLEYFRREDKNAWWEYFRLRELDNADARQERNAATGLTFVEIRPKIGKERNITHRYNFDKQFVTLNAGDELYEASSEDGAPKDFIIGNVVAVDHKDCTIDIKKKSAAKDKHPHTVFHHRFVGAGPLPKTLLDLGQNIADGKYSNNISSAQYDLLAKNPPRFNGGITIASTLEKHTDTTNITYELVSNLDSSVLAIQGPPGTGKTFTGSHVIARLVNAGNKVGITGGSHAVIANLLRNVSEVDSNLTIAHRGDETQATAPGCKKLPSTKDNIIAALEDGWIVGATAWTWAAPEMDQSLDYLFIDEAGQMSLATALAVARAAKNVILLGDPQQLEQPQRATHPEGSNVAALAHLIGDQQTINDKQGLFLGTTYRMHPNICNFTSDQYYEQKLTAAPELISQIISGPSPQSNQQLVFKPVLHTNNQNRSEEEAVAINELVNSLITKNHQWTDSKNESHNLEAKHFLVVAPYNAQVSLLRQNLPERVRVGTVDKFQGQQAPVVIYSLTSSTAAEAPRGMSFLFSPNRFNVATSRARCTVFVFGSPELVMAECKTPEQIKWANGLCRYVEYANL